LTGPEHVYAFGAAGTSEDKFIFAGINDLVVILPGSTLDGTTLGGDGFFLGAHGAQIFDSDVRTARIETVERGATSIRFKAESLTKVSYFGETDGRGRVDLMVAVPRPIRRSLLRKTAVDQTWRIDFIPPCLLPINHMASIFCR
jgi:hypothetical protein